MKIWKRSGKDSPAAAAINRWLWPRLMPELCAPHGGTLFLGCGPALSAHNPALEHHPRIIVFGAGASDPLDLPDFTAADWDLRFLRGPETAEALGLRGEHWLCDPAALTADALPGPLRRRRWAGPRRVAFMPGPLMAEGAAQRLAAAAGLHMIQTEGRMESWLHQLLDCDALICAEPAAAAAADSLGIPWRPLSVSRDGEKDARLEFEWRDWTRAMDLFSVALSLRPPAEARPGEPLSRVLDGIALRRAASDLRAAARTDQWSLSDRTLLRQRLEAMREALAEMRDDFAPREARRKGVGAIAARGHLHVVGGAAAI
ncbi:hypothetical protein ACQ5SO_08365 [Rhodovulum sp. DZ06]|uniref:hypothetical protein n=1 Tax=Rhodovulum sp. DZ06 TaxID=3425126 RepID=UPI003D34DDB5